MLATTSPNTSTKSLRMTDLSCISLRASPMDMQDSDNTGVMVQLEHSLHLDCLKNYRILQNTNPYKKDF